MTINKMKINLGCRDDEKKDLELISKEEYNKLQDSERKKIMYFDMFIDIPCYYKILTNIENYSILSYINNK